jgi:hypothetical protein
MSRDLDGDVSGCAKSIESQFAARLNSGEAQAAKANNSGAEERDGLLVWKLLGDGVDKVLRRNNVLGVAAVNGIAREGRMVAKIFRARATEFASAVSVMQPGDAYTGAEGKPGRVGSQLFDDANDLVPWNYGRFFRN